ncbi:oligosaccharide reducing-end xylanase [Tunturiibacter psychrotolerans]
MFRTRCVLLTTVLALCQTLLPATEKDAERGAFYTGRYRDLFAEIGHSPDESRARINAAFQQLFHGDQQTQTLFYEVGGNKQGALAYITDIANHDVRTEGMSYGMMISVQMDRKREFDALWNWANTYMLITDRKDPGFGYYKWSMNIDGSPHSSTPAPDGEEYFVMSLYFAANRWGSGRELYNYKAQADRLLHLMRHHPVMTGSTHSGIRTIGPMVDEKHHMIRFVPDSPNEDFTDPSYHLPAYYELWARWGPPEDRAFWAQAAETSRRFFLLTTDPKTGLSPDYANWDGSPRPSFNHFSTDFSYDSWRTASNWSVDASWWAKSPEESELSNRIQQFLFAQDLAKFDDQYTLAGLPLSQRHSVGMVATMAVASLAATNNHANAFVENLWNSATPYGEQRYYDGLLYLMGLLHCSGNFRVYGPKYIRPGH